MNSVHWEDEQNSQASNNYKTDHFANLLRLPRLKDCALIIILAYSCLLAIGNLAKQIIHL